MTATPDSFGPRVLFVSAIGGGNGGPVKSLVELVGSLDLPWSGAIGPFTAEVLERLEASTDAQVSTPPWHGVGRARLVGRLAGAIRTYRPDVVFANGLTEAAASVLALTTAAHRPRLAVWVHSSSVPRISRSLGSLLRRQRGAWAAVSEFSADLTEKAIGPVGCTVIPNPVSSDVVGARAEHPDGRTRIGYFGSDRAHKGFALLPDIIEQLADENVVWRLYTWPVVEQPAWSRVRDLQDRGLIEHARSISDVAAGYGTVDIVFVPSLIESFCRVVVEANLNGLPVVASDLPPIRQLTQANRTATLFPPGDVNAAVAALRDLIRHPQDGREMGARGRAAASVFTPEMVSAMWQEKIERLVDEAR